MSLPLGLMYPYAITDQVMDIARLHTWNVLGLQYLVFPPTITYTDPTNRGRSFEKELLDKANTLGMTYVRSSTGGRLPPWQNYYVGMATPSKIMSLFVPDARAYVVGHEIYDGIQPGKLTLTLSAITQTAPAAEVFFIGNLAYQLTQTPRFGEVFFTDPRRIYAHEAYYNQVGTPWDTVMARWTADVTTFPKEARWWAVLYVGDEWVGGDQYLRAPTFEEFQAWVWVALSHGAKGFWLFPGSTMAIGGRRYVGLDHQPALQTACTWLSHVLAGRPPDEKPA